MSQFRGPKSFRGAISHGPTWTPWRASGGAEAGQTEREREREERERENGVAKDNGSDGDEHIHKIIMQ